MTGVSPGHLLGELETAALNERLAISTKQPGEFRGVVGDSQNILNQKKGLKLLTEITGGY